VFGRYPVQLGGDADEVVPAAASQSGFTRVTVHQKKAARAKSCAARSVPNPYKIDDFERESVNANK